MFRSKLKSVSDISHPLQGIFQLCIIGNNLQNVTLSLPLGLLIAITGVSGSGKSTLINGTLMPIAARELNRATTLTAAPYEKIEGLDQLDKVIDIDQSPIGRTPRSNPAWPLRAWKR